MSDYGAFQPFCCLRIIQWKGGLVAPHVELEAQPDLTVLWMHRYFLRVKITRQYAADIKQTLDFAVANVSPPPEINNSIKMEVGIEDCLHIEFEYNKSKYVFRSDSLTMLASGLLTGARACLDTTCKTLSLERSISCWCASRSSTWRW